MSLKYVHPSGSLHSGLVIIGEAPGEQEDLQGMPFVGRSGKYLDKMLGYIELWRQEVYITNIVKVRPPDNRKPTDEEIDSWRPVLFKELSQLDYSVIMTLGSSAIQAILSDKLPITKIRGQVFYHPELRDVPVIPTYHPSYLLRKASDETIKGQVKEDLMLVKNYLKKH